jgi:hypothetical protein
MGVVPLLDPQPGERPRPGGRAGRQGDARRGSPRRPRTAVGPRHDAAADRRPGGQPRTLGRGGGRRQPGRPRAPGPGCRGFDRVLVDAPCSGEGMFRKSDAARERWSPARVEAARACSRPARPRGRSRAPGRRARVRHLHLRSRGGRGGRRGAARGGGPTCAGRTSTPGRAPAGRIPAPGPWRRLRALVAAPRRRRRPLRGALRLRRAAGGRRRPRASRAACPAGAAAARVGRGVRRPTADAAGAQRLAAFAARRARGDPLPGPRARVADGAVTAVPAAALELGGPWRRAGVALGAGAQRSPRRAPLRAAPRALARPPRPWRGRRPRRPGGRRPARVRLPARRERRRHGHRGLGPPSGGGRPPRLGQGERGVAQQPLPQGPAARSPDRATVEPERRSGRRSRAPRSGRGGRAGARSTLRATPCRARAPVLDSRLVSRASALATTTVTPITRPRTRPAASALAGVTREVRPA